MNFYVHLKDTALTNITTESKQKIISNQGKKNLVFFHFSCQEIKKKKPQQQQPGSLDIGKHSGNVLAASKFTETSNVLYGTLSLTFCLRG